ncbi:MAG: HNH endonuclease [Pyrinomonadaceae bacterium]
MFVRGNYTCQYCGRKGPDVSLHVDHRTPPINIPLIQINTRRCL